jgi:PAS domain S-box-containing protein/putative nucleotidyltransferase with HDIG domain
LINKKSSTPSGFIQLFQDPRRVLRIGLVVVAYLVVFICVDLLTKQFSELPGIVAWYPPAGLTYALLLVFGIAFTPAVTIALISDSMFIYHMPQSPWLLILWALIISLIYGFTALFLRKHIRLDWQLQKLRDVIWFVFTIALVSAVLAVLSVLSSALSGGIPRSEIILNILNWWIGETVGVLTVTPFLLTYVMPGLKRFIEGEPIKFPTRRPIPRITLSAFGQAASIVFTLYWVFGSKAPVEFRPLYLIALPLLWIALQRGFKGTTATILVVNAGVVFALMLFRFDLARLEELQLMMIINSVVYLLLGAVVTEQKLSQKTLKESEAQYRTMFERMTQGVVYQDAVGKIISANPAAERILGLTLDQMKGRKSTDPRWKAIHEDGSDFPGDTHPSIVALATGREIYNTVMGVFIPKKKGHNWININAIPQFRPGETVPFQVFTTFEDFTERKQYEEQIQVLSKIPSESPNPIMRVTKEGALIYASPSSAHLLAMWRARIGRFLPIKLRGKIKEVFTAGNYQEVEVRCGKKVYSLILAPIVDAGYVNLYGRDITQRKRAEESNQRQLADLELLYENSLSINGLLKLEEISAKVIEAIIKKGLSWRHVAIHLYHPESQQLELLAHSYPGIRAEVLQAEKQRVSKLISNPNEGFVGWVIQHGELVRCGNVTEDTRYIMAYPDISSGIYVPMKSGDRIIGVIGVESEQADAFTKADEHLLETLAAQASASIDNARLFSEINRSNLDLVLAYDATIEGWSHALDFRDRETEGHSQRVTEMTWKLAKTFGMNQEELVNIRWGALLHDIGKMGVPDRILFKAASLTDVEWMIMKKHPTFAFEWLSPIKYLHSALDIPYSHHEKWDGTGYPRGLKGESIPLSARIFAIVDVWDALTSDRPYRAAWTQTKALEYIQEQRGKHFDPQVVSTFLEMKNR